MSIIVQVGKTLPLNLTLEGGESDLFPTAKVFDQANSEVSGSPFPLSHIGAGLYRHESFLITKTIKRLFAVYVVYSDALKTQEAYYYGHAQDVFDVSALESSIKFDISVPNHLELPLTGTKLYRFVVYVFDAFGSPADPDNNEVILHLEDIWNGEIITPVALIREQTGVYFYRYEVKYNDFEQPLWAEFVFKVNDIPYLIGRVTETVRVRSSMEELLVNRLTAARALKLDFLDVAVSSRLSQVSGLQYRNDILASIALHDAHLTSVDNHLSVVELIANAIKTATDRIGVPHYGSIVADLEYIWRQTDKIGNPVHTTLANDIAFLDAHILDVFALANDIKDDTVIIGPSMTGSITSDINRVYTRLGIPVSGTIAGDISLVLGQGTVLTARIGFPHTGSLSGDIEEVKLDTTTLLSRLSEPRAEALDLLDAPISSLESESSAHSRDHIINIKLDEILAGMGLLPDSNIFVGNVPPILLLPQTGSKSYKFYANVFTQQGKYSDPDGQAINISIEDISGAIVVPSTPMDRISTGYYSFNYIVASSNLERPLFVKFNYAMATLPYTQIKLTETQEFESKLQTLLQLITPSRAANLDFLDVAVSSRLSTNHANFRFDSLDSGIEILDVELNSVHNLISDVEDKVDTVIGLTSKIGNPVHGTLALDNVAIESHTAKIGNPPHGTIGQDLQYIENLLHSSEVTLELIQDEVEKIGTPTYGSISQDIANLESMIGDTSGPILSAISVVDSHVLQNIGITNGVATNVNTALSKLNQIIACCSEVRDDVSVLPSMAVDLTTILNRIGVPISSLAQEIQNIFIEVEGTHGLITDGFLSVLERLGMPQLTSTSADIDRIWEYVKNIPYNPLTVNDPRLIYLDATISSRATPFDLLNFAQGLNMLEIQGMVDSTSAEFTEIIGVILPEDNFELEGLIDSNNDIIGLIEEEA